MAIRSVGFEVRPWPDAPPAAAGGGTAALFDNASMWMAVFADMGASLLVAFNGQRLLRTGGLK